MRRTFWSLMLTGIAVTALAGFSPTTQEADAGLFSRLRAHFGGNCGSYNDGYGSCAAPVSTCACPPVVYDHGSTCATPAPCGACGHSPCACATDCGCPSPCGHGGCGGGGCNEDSDDDCDDDCDD